jgi:hypothetical protein
VNAAGPVLQQPLLVSLYFLWGEASQMGLRGLTGLVMAIEFVPRP